MLLTGLQRHAQSWSALGVDRDPDDSAWRRSFIGVSSGEIRGMRAAVAHGYSESLGAADHYIGLQFPRRFDDRQSENIRGNGRECILVVHFGNGFGRIP